MSIIKRKKTANYLQLHNYPVQEDLTDLSAIGLLTYMMSLPEDWVLHKTQLQKHFSRRKTDSAFKILLEKRYAVGFIAYVDGKKTFHYSVSDIPFDEDDFLSFVDETLKELLNNSNSVYSLSAIMDNYFEIPDAEHFSSNVQNVQYIKYSSLCTVQNVHIQKKQELKNYEQINTEKEILVNKDEPVNNSEIDNDIYNLENEYVKKGLSKDVIKRLYEEIKEKRETTKNFPAYYRGCLENTLSRSNQRKGKQAPGDKLKDIPDYPDYNYLDE